MGSHNASPYPQMGSWELAKTLLINWRSSSGKNSSLLPGVKALQHDQGPNYAWYPLNAHSLYQIHWTLNFYDHSPVREAMSNPAKLLRQHLQVHSRAHSHLLPAMPLSVAPASTLPRQVILEIKSRRQPPSLHPFEFELIVLLWTRNPNVRGRLLLQKDHAP